MMRQTWTAKFHPQHLIFLSAKHWHQGTDGGISKPCEKRQQSSCSSIFFFFLSWLSPARKAHPRSLHHQPQTPRQEKSHYISCHTKSLSRCGWREHASALVWCSRPRIPQTLHLSPWLEPSCSSNKWDTFHGDLRWRNTSLIWFVLTKPMCLKPPPAKVVASEFVGMRYAI